MRPSQSGFTLVETLVSLVIASLVMGGIMGVMSANLRAAKRMENKTRDLAVLEAAAQYLLARPELARPELARPGSLVIRELDSAEVEVEVETVEAASSAGWTNRLKNARLLRIRLIHSKTELEFSLIVPNEVRP